MKTSLWLTLAVASAVVGCRKEEVGSLDPKGGANGGIRFETHVGGTSKGVSKDQFVTGDRFEVIGYSATTDFTGAGFAMPSDAELLFVGDTTYFPLHRAMVSATQGEKSDQLIWNYHPMIYWPAKEGVSLKASFVAFSPEATDANKIFADTVRVKQGKDRLGNVSPAEPQLRFEVIGGTTTFTEKALADARLKNIEQIDLLTAQNLNIAVAPAAGVTLEFKHALTKVRFSVKGAQNRGVLRIVSVLVSGVANKGELKLMYDQSKSGDFDYIGGWKIANPITTTDTLSFPVSLNSINAAAIDAGKLVSVVDNHEALLMIPQDLTNVTVKVVYAHSIDGGITWQKYIAGDGSRKISLATAGVPFWKPNMAINYVMDINPGQPVSFVPELGEWDRVDEQYVPTFKATGMPQKVTTIELTKDDVVTTDGNVTWITIEDPTAAVVKPHVLSSAYTVAKTQNYVFRVAANGKEASREAKIKITRPNAEPKKVRVISIEIAQSKLDVKRNDYYYADGTYATQLEKSKKPVGVVYAVDPVDLAKFSVVAFDQSAPVAWGPADLQINSATYPIGWNSTGTAADEPRVNGKANAKYLLDWIADATANTTGKTAADFSAFKYCNDYQKWGVAGWSVPALNQLQMLYGAFNGKDAVTPWASGAATLTADPTAQSAFNALFVAASGTGFANAVYGSLTEDATAMANVWTVGFADGTTAASPKTTTLPVRCVYEVNL